MRIVQVREFGSPEVLKVAEAEEPQAGPGQVVIKVEAAGVAFGQVLLRSGRYPRPLPFVPGWEVGGRVIQVGPDVDPALAGQSVVANTPEFFGGYAEQVVVNSAHLFRVPPQLSLEQATRVFFAGQTAVSILKTVSIRPDDAVLVTAAAGATGSLVLQLAKTAGARTVIGAARGQDKLAAIRQLGADAAIDYSEDNWGEQVRQVTDGKGASVVIDNVGGRIARQAFEATANGHGHLVVFGASSGEGVALDTQEIARRGITVIGALGIALTLTEQETRACAEHALSEAAAGRLLPIAGPTYPLAQASAAHAALEARQIIGKALLIP